MAARLGNVLYWTATTIAVLLALLAARLYEFGGSEPLAIWGVIIVAALVWLIGRACRYILAGR
jgi:hypothetical protein